MKKREESKENSYDATFKIVVFGDSSKTSVIQRYLTGLFKEHAKKMTIGVDFEVKSLEINKKKIKLQIWDFGGEERFRFLLPTYIRGANGAIFMYDITNYSSLAQIDDWLMIIRKELRDEDQFPIVLAGVSMRSEEDRTITSDEGLKVAKKYNLDGFIECSPRTGENVEEMFEELAKLMIQELGPIEIRPYPKKRKQISEKEDIKKILSKSSLSLERKEEIKRIGLIEEDVKKRLKDLSVKLKDLDIDLEKLDITWNSFIESITTDYTRQTIFEFNGNWLIPYAHYLESKLSLLYSGVYERIDDKIDLNYVNKLERSFFPRRIFKVNDLLTLKLEYKRTFIYIKGKRFIQCIRLFLQIPPQESDLYEEIESIDEAAKVYKQSLWENRIVEGPMARLSQFQNITITPEQEFWGHCSNLQAWAEHDYDTRLLRSNLSFPLLKALSDAGDPKAKTIFQEEIAKRFESGYPSVVNYLIERGYLRYLDTDQLKTLLENIAVVDDQETIKYCQNCGTELVDPTQKICPNCGIPFKFMNMIKTFKEEDKNVAGVILKGRQIIYTTDNWDISEDIDSLLSIWFRQEAQFFMFSGVKYSILQLEPDRLVAISRNGEGYILATKDDDYILILQLNLNNLKKIFGETRYEKEVPSRQLRKYLKSIIESRLAKTTSAIDIAPQLKDEIKDLDKRKEFFKHHLVNLESVLSKINKLLPTLSESEFKDRVIEEKNKSELEIRILKGSIEYLGNQIEINNLREECKSLMVERKQWKYIEHLVKKKLYEIHQLKEKNKKIKNKGMELFKND